jgi:hypothetical protein
MQTLQIETVEDRMIVVVCPADGYSASTLFRQIALKRFSPCNQIQGSTTTLVLMPLFRDQSHHYRQEGLKRGPDKLAARASTN